MKNFQALAAFHPKRVQVAGNRLGKVDAPLLVGLLDGAAGDARFVIDGEDAGAVRSAADGIAVGPDFLPGATSGNERLRFGAQRRRQFGHERLQHVALARFQWSARFALHAAAAPARLQLTGERRLQDAIGNEYVVNCKHDAFNVGCRGRFVNDLRPVALLFLR